MQLCVERFSGDAAKSFSYMIPMRLSDTARLFHADLAISLEVIFHLTEDQLFEQYMSYLFTAADRYVIIYSSNTENSAPRAEPHYNDRAFTSWVDWQAPDWTLREVIPNRYPYNALTAEGSTSDFYIYTRR